MIKTKMSSRLHTQAVSRRKQHIGDQYFECGRSLVAYVAVVSSRLAHRVQDEMLNAFNTYSFVCLIY